MEPLDSRAVSVSLASYARDRLAESDFFAELSVGEVPPEHYGVTVGLGFFGPRADPGTEHSQALREAFAQDSMVDSGKLIGAAQLEIWEHITFWDDVYATVRAASRESQESAAGRVMGETN